MSKERLIDFPALPQSDPQQRRAVLRRVNKLVARETLGKLIPRSIKPLAELSIVYDPTSVAAERYRTLRHTLDTLVDPPRLVTVVSALPRDGRSTVAANLALAYAAENKGPVLLVDADFRRPWLHQLVTPQPTLGLSHVVTGEIAAEYAILPIQKSSLCVLPVGEIPADPRAILGSSEFQDFVASLRRDFHRVVIDTPPILGFRDAQDVAKKSDGALVIVRGGGDTRAIYIDALARLAGVRVLGTVRNCASASTADVDRLADRNFTHRFEGKPRVIRRRRTGAEQS